jgi:hypothetical protein
LNGGGVVHHLQHGALHSLKRDVEIDLQRLEGRVEAFGDAIGEVGVGQGLQAGGDAVHRAHTLGDVGGELHHLGHLAVQVEDRIVGSLDPHLAPVLADALELGGDEFARI